MVFGAVEDALFGTRLETLAAGIRIVHDPVPVDDAAFDRAHEIVRQAGLVCCLGFGYHPTNIGRLQLHKSIRPDARFLGSTYHMGDAEVQQAQNVLNRPLARGTSDLKCVAFLRECVELV